MGPSFPLGQPQQGPMWGLTLSFLQLCNTESHLSCLLAENKSTRNRQWFVLSANYCDFFELIIWLMYFSTPAPEDKDNGCFSILSSSTEHSAWQRIDTMAIFIKCGMTMGKPVSKLRLSFCFVWAPSSPEWSFPLLIRNTKYRSSGFCFLYLTQWVSEPSRPKLGVSPFATFRSGAGGEKLFAFKLLACTHTVHVVAKRTADKPGANTVVFSFFAQNKKLKFPRFHRLWDAQKV